MRLRACFLAVLAASVAAPVHAQTSLEVGPLVGYYQPTGQFQTGSTYFTDLPARPQDLSAVVWGGELRVWLGRRLGVQVQGGVASRRVPTTLVPVIVGLPAQRVSATRARIVLASVLLLYDLSPAPNRYRLWLGAGPGLVQHGGTTYQPFGSPVSSAGVVDVGASVPLFSNVRAAGGLQTTLYDFHMTAPPSYGAPGMVQSGFQTDVLFHLELTWTLRW